MNADMEGDTCVEKNEYVNKARTELFQNYDVYALR
jgi:hypothetical protein